MTSKCISVGLLLAAETFAMSLWFASAAVLPEMAREADLAPARHALMTSAVQAGFVVGALAVAVSGIADRLDPRRVLSVSALAAAAANVSLLAVPVGSTGAVLLRAVTGVFLAGVYPVGMKIMVGWGVRDRSLLVGLFVGALTLGSALPHLLSLSSGLDWRFTIVATSLCGTIAGLLVLATGLGPHHTKAPSFDPAAIRVAWTDPAIRLAYLGYLGHMWELYAMWAWVAVAARASYLTSLAPATATWLAKMTAFLAIALGAVACGIAGTACRPHGPSAGSGRRHVRQRLCRARDGGELRRPGVGHHGAHRDLGNRHHPGLGAVLSSCRGRCAQAPYGQPSRPADGSGIRPDDPDRAGDPARRRSHRLERAHDRPRPGTGVWGSRHALVPRTRPHCSAGLALSSLGPALCTLRRGALVLPLPTLVSGTPPQGHGDG